MEKFFQATVFSKMGGGAKIIEKMEVICHAQQIGPFYTYWPMFLKRVYDFDPAG